MVHFEPPHFGLGLGARRMILAYFVLWWAYFKQILFVFCIAYGCGGDSDRKYEKVSGIIIRIKKKPAKKKKSGNLMKRAQKKFERDPRKKKFCERNPRLCESKKLRTKFAI